MIFGTPNTKRRKNIASDKNTTLDKLRKPKHHNRSIKAIHTNSKNNPNFDPTLPLMVLFSLFILMRVCTYFCIRIFIPDDEDLINAALRQQQRQRGSDDEATNDDNNISISRFLLTRRGAGPFLRRRRRTTEAPGSRRARYNALVERLNRTRAENGERPISAESLRLVLSTRDFNGDDYEHLLQFNEENGPAMNAFLSSIGATRAEIERLPSHSIEPGDELLSPPITTIDENAVEDSPVSNRRFCSICLEGYEVGQVVRTIPCFHTFHAPCIDRWLTQKAECPICKFPAIG